MTSLPELQEVGGCPSMSSLALCSEAGPSHMQPWAYSGIMAKAPNQHCLLGEIPCFRSCPNLLLCCFSLQGHRHNHA